ncbi:uncharacterized protein LOC143513774 [Brachyhypopomus gauderio]|uniref:uncharacterized protein LOC143513774 n=1 Tax=Brachyhypopomus gauderio TaxID=698409 RepID=UPI004042935F
MPRMGITDNHAVMGEPGGWPAELRFRKTRRGRTRKSCPSGEVSPVLSFYSEPASDRKRKDVTSKPRPHVRGPHQEEEDDEEDTRSLKSLPTVINTLAFDTKVKRSHRLPREHILPDVTLTPLVTSRCTLVVEGTAYTRDTAFLPDIKYKTSWERKTQEGPPRRAGRRLDNAHTGQNGHLHTLGCPSNAPPCDRSGKMAGIGESSRCQPSVSCPRVSLAPRIPSRKIVAQSIPPLTMVESRRTGGAPPPLKPVLMTSQVPKRGALQRLLDEGYLTLAGDPGLLEPFSGFQEHLCRQLLNSPLPLGTEPSRVRSPVLLRPDRPHARAAPPAPQGPAGSRTVELCHSRGRRLPRITMTRPTPSPKHLHLTEQRHLA